MAAGLWENGYAVDYEYLITKSFPEDKKLRKQLEKWQDIYEDFNFYTSKEITKKEQKSKKFKKFMKLGEKIFRKIDMYNRELKLGYNVEYFNEKNYNRYRLKNDKLKKVKKI